MPSCRAAARSHSPRCWNSSETLAIDASVVRTAMSRLTADGWFERSKIGRNSFYRLVQKGRLTFDIATRHIYDPPPSDWTGRFELLLIGNAEDRDASREALKNAGFGSPVPGVWVAPSGAPIPEEASRAIRLEVSAEDDSGRRLLAESWPLERTADAYLKFMKTFEPLRSLHRTPRKARRCRRLHRARAADPSLSPRGAARSPVAGGAAACGLAGQGGPRALRPNLSRAVVSIRTMA